MEDNLRNSRGALFDAARPANPGELFVAGYLNNFSSPTALVARVRYSDSLNESDVTTESYTTDGILLKRPIYREQERLFGLTNFVRRSGDRPAKQALWENVFSKDTVFAQGTMFGLQPIPGNRVLITGRSGGLLATPKPIVAFHDTATSITTLVGPEKTGLMSGGTLYAPTTLSSGKVVVGGFEQTKPNEFLTVISIYDPDADTWSVSKPEKDGVRLSGTILGLHEIEAGGAIAYGYLGTPEDSEILILTTQNFEEWGREIISFPDGPLKGNISGVRPLAEGGWLFSGRDQESRSLFFLETDLEFSQGRFTQPSLIGNLVPQSQGLAALINVSDHQIAFMGQDVFLKSLPKDEAAKVVDAIATTALIPEGFAVPREVKEYLVELTASIARLKELDATLFQQKNFLSAVRSSLQRQEESASNVDKLSQELERALAASDAVRQAGQIATRLAIVALLIYLVQIIANRYRFFQRMANFYGSRAKILRILKMQANEGTGVQALSLNEIVASFNSDMIRFERGKEPLLSELVPLVEAANKRP